MEGPKVGELFVVDKADKGKEIKEVPLCARCLAEIGTEEMDEQHLIPMALGRVERFDGGLSRRRWEARQMRPEPQLEPEPETIIPSSSSRLPPGDSHQRPPSPIYVSIHDPLGLPAFKRSPTKPIPKWMQYLPSQRLESRDCPPPRPASVLDSYFSPTGSSAVDSDDEDRHPPPVPPHTVLVRRPSPVPVYAPFQMSRPFTLITEEPVQRPSSTKLKAAHCPPHNKHVRFTPGQTVPQTYVSIHDKGKAPSESSEYLERYKVSSAGATKPMPTLLEVPKAGDSRYTGPRARERSAGESSISSAQSQVLHVCPREENLPSSAEQSHRPHRAQSTALSLAARYGISSGRKEGDQGDSARHEHVHLPIDDHHGGGDGASEQTDMSESKRPATFQDQLKRVFGFS